LAVAEHGLDSLVQRCNRGDKQAWEEFYTTYFGLVSSVAKRYSSQANDAEDIIQEVFVNLFKALRQYDPARPIETYILEIARRVRIGRYRKASAMKRAGNPVPVDLTGCDSERGFIAVASADENQEDSLIKAQEKGLLRKALNGISQNCRDLLALRYDQALSYKQIAEMLKVKEVTLRSQLQRCLASLSKSYSKLALLGGG
jgi:RNA polymerase sigma-70 factor, ECF subfamily